MSTLTSTQLNVRRSSTRVHGPPGGASQLSFGPGGFGTPAIPQEIDPELRDVPSTPHQRADFIPQKPTMQQQPMQRSNNQQQQPGYQQPGYQQQQPGYQQHQPGYQQQQPGYQQQQPGYQQQNAYRQQQPLNNQQYGGYQQQRPPPTGYSQGPPPTAYSHPPSTAMPQQQGYGAPPSTGALRPSTTGSGWCKAMQPPLTSSKRDQNWERKRRQWLAKKNGGLGASGGSSFSSSYDNTPPSPLSKLMNNVSIGSQEPQYSHMAPPRTQQSFQAPQQSLPPRTAYPEAPRTQQSMQGYSDGPQRSIHESNSRGYLTSGPPPTGYTRQNNPNPQGDYGSKSSNVFMNSGAAQFGSSYQGNRLPTGNSIPPTASSTRSTRQAPGGTSNWSPYG